jgi:hypothetical protein
MMTRKRGRRGGERKMKIYGLLFKILGLLPTQTKLEVHLKKMKE